MRTIQTTATAPRDDQRRRMPVVLRRGSWAAAAGILLIVGVYMFTSSTTPAMASINAIIDALGRPGDRTYHVAVAHADGHGRPGLDRAILYSRDGQQFLLVRIDPKGGELFDGFDGQRSWRVRAGVLVEAQDGPGASRIPMPEIMTNVPFADLLQTLQRIRADYTIERTDQAPLQPGGESLTHVRARRNSRSVKGPPTIEIWADSETGLPHHIVFHRAKFQGSQRPRRLELELTASANLPEDWFSPSVHVTNAAERRP
ncbi:MAG: hypothetical protein KKB50_07290 [Planctomycetes bacterium]|nr:hypothetical protein [Planctomycetota bacterium]